MARMRDPFVRPPGLPRPGRLLVSCPPTEWNVASLVGDLLLVLRISSSSTASAGGLRVRPPYCCYL